MNCCMFWLEGTILRKLIKNKGSYVQHLLQALVTISSIIKLKFHKVLECVSQWQGTWQYVETSINMKFCNMNDVLYDKWNKKLDNLHNLNTKHKKTYINK